MRLRTRTIRLRLTLIYGGVFLVSAVALLTLGYLLVRHNLDHHHTFRDEINGLGAAVYHSLFGRLPAPPGSRRAFLAGYHQAIAAALHKLLLEYIGAVVVMTAASVALGWWMAGRALAPLRAIAATARRVSGENLGERIALQGPEDELKELADTFDGMLARLDAAFASQRHFVANASHELRTPLAIMRTEVDVALADPDAERAGAARDGGGRARDDRPQRVADRRAAVPRAQRGRSRARGAGRPGGAGRGLHHRPASPRRGGRESRSRQICSRRLRAAMPRCSSGCSPIWWRTASVTTSPGVS